MAAGSVWVFPVGSLIWLKGLLCGWVLVVLFFMPRGIFGAQVTERV